MKTALKPKHSYSPPNRTKGSVWTMMMEFCLFLAEPALLVVTLNPRDLYCLGFRVDRTAVFLFCLSTVFAFFFFTSSRTISTLRCLRDRWGERSRERSRGRVARPIETCVTLHFLSACILFPSVALITYIHAGACSRMLMARAVYKTLPRRLFHVFSIKFSRLPPCPLSTVSTFRPVARTVARPVEVLVTLALSCFFVFLQPHQHIRYHT